MLDIKKIMIGKVEVHLIGAQHGWPFLGRTLAGLNEDEKFELNRYLSLNAFCLPSSIGLLEIAEEGKHKTWERFIGADPDTLSKSVAVESKDTIKISNDKVKRMLVKSFSQLPIKQKAIVAVALPILSGISVIGFYFPTFRSRMNAGLSKLAEAQYPKMIGRGDTVFRSFVQARAVQSAIKTLPVKRIFLFQGAAHVPSTQRFLKDKAYARRYVCVLNKLAPRASKILGETTKKVNTRLLSRRTKLTRR